MYALAGVRFNDVALHPTSSTAQWQLLDIPLLTHDPVESIWYLHSQPPLYNIIAALLLQLPHALVEPAAAGIFLVLGLAMAISTYLILTEMTVPPIAATVVTLIFVVASPSMILYENYFSWSYPTAACLTVGVLCICRYLKTTRFGWGLGGLIAFVAATMMDTTFQWLWLVPIVVAIAIFMRPRWRQALAVAAVPLVLVGGLILKNAVMFGTTTTSSWVGMNLAQMTVEQSSQRLLHSLKSRGYVNDLAFQPPFSDLSIYSPRYKGTATSTVPALNEITTSANIPNFNNIQYIALSNAYLHDDVGYLKAEPLRYIQTVSRSARIWFVPSNQFPFIWSPVPNNPYLLGPENVVSYASLYDNFVLLEPGKPKFSYFVVKYISVAPRAATFSYSVVFEYLVLFFGVPIVVLRRRRRLRRTSETGGAGGAGEAGTQDATESRVAVGTLSIVWFTCVYSFAVTSLLAIGENMRFRFELGTMPLIGCVVVVTEFVRVVKARRKTRDVRRKTANSNDPAPTSYGRVVTPR
ncbi:MAG: glycosyltransferase family 87 protein [Acidimicrobiales bacterium]